MVRGISLAGSFLVCGLAFADPAHAEIVIEASFGQGMQLSPRPSGAAQATSLMVAPGYIFFDTVRLELGLVAAVDAIRGGAFSLSLIETVQNGSWRRTSGSANHTFLAHGD